METKGWQQASSTDAISFLAQGAQHRHLAMQMLLPQCQLLQRSYGEGNAAAILSRASPKPCENGSEATGGSRGRAAGQDGGKRTRQSARL